MNHSYRVVWNVVTKVWQAVSEIARGRGKSKSVSQTVGVVITTATMLGVGAQAFAAGSLPTGGNVVAGSGTINQSGSSMTINQNTAKLAIDWQSFSVGQGNSVNFVQPNASSVALNRVLGSDVSVIQGAINANGQVFLLNPNGVLFSPTAQVNVGSLIASTLKMSTDDFMAGHYKLSGDSTNAVINQGNITVVGDGIQGGTVALIAAKVSNDAQLTANGGNVLLGAGSEVTLDLGGPVKLQVSKGAVDALVQNGGAIQADGGVIYLTARAVDSLTAATINNTGVIRAQTLATGEKGEIRLIADMQSGTANVGGVLDASAPRGGDGGFIETSGAHVNTSADLVVNAGASQGQGGSWLLDPYDYVIGSSQASTIAGVLNGGSNVTVSTDNNNYVSGYTPSSGSGDITVNSAISKTAGGNASLTLTAYRNININESITSTSGALNITLSAANNTSTGTLGGVRIADGKTLNSKGGNILIGGAGGSVSAAQTVSNGIGYALNASSNLEAVYIGASTSVLSGGGNITINGYSTQPLSGSNDTTGVHIGAGATIDSGFYASGATAASKGGYINFSGKYVGGVGSNTDKVFGVKIDNPNSGHTTISASTTTGGIRINGSSTWDVDGSYALNMTTYGHAGSLYFNSYSVADLLFITNGSLRGVTFTYSPPTSGCRADYPNCGTLVINTNANNSYLYATYNAVNMSTLPVYVSATLTGTKVYDGATSASVSASNLTINNIQILDPNNSGYSSNNVTSATYTTPSPDVGNYLNLSANAQTRNYTTVNGNNYVVGYNFTVNPAYTITAAPLGIAVSGNYNGSNTFSSNAATITTTGLASTDHITSVTINDPNVSANYSNYVTGLTGTTTNGTGTFLASNYTLPSVSYTVADGAGTATMRAPLSGTQTPTTSTNAVWLNQATILGLTVSGTYNGTKTFSSGIGTVITASGLASGDVIDSVSVNDANVSSNGANFVTGILIGHNTNINTSFNAGNYSFNGSALYTLTGSQSTFAGTLASGVTPTAGNSPVNSTNAVWIKPAPLGIYATPTYNGSNSFTINGGTSGTGTVDTGGSVKVAGLVNNETLAGFSLNNANVSQATLVNGITLSNGQSASNYVLNSTLYPVVSGTPVAGTTSITAGGVTSTTDATNQATLGKAALGIDVVGVYNGTTGLSVDGTSTVTPSNAVIYTNGLIAGETITGVTIGNANVTGNGSNTVTSATGGGTNNNFDIGNYQLGSSQIVTGSTTFNGTQTSTPATTTNATWLKPAPLGVAVSGSPNGTTTMSTANGASINASGLVGQDTNGVSLTSATLSSANAGAANKVVSLAGTGTFDIRNYVLNGAIYGSATSLTAGTAGNGTDATNAVTTTATTTAELPPPPPSPIVVPAFVDNGIKALGSDVRPTSFGGLNYVAHSGDAVSTGGSSLNFESVPANNTNASSGTVSERPTSAAAGSAQGAEQATTGGNALNFVSTNTPAEGSSGTAPNAPAAGGRNAKSELNVNTVSVPSAAGPLDVFVVGSGVNRSGISSVQSIDKK